MTIRRYEQRRKFTNGKYLYRELFEARDVKFIRQYDSPRFSYPTESEINSLELFEHAWSRGDKLSKLAEKNYGDARLWWVIAWFNKKPAEPMYKIGDIVQIPFPLERVLNFFGV